MTCGKCEKHVEEAVASLDGVRSVRADRASEQVRIESDGPVDLDAARAAIEEEGYEVVD